MTPLVLRTTAAIEFEVLAAAPLRVDRDEDAAAASEVDVDVRADWDIGCCCKYSGTAEEDGALVEVARETRDDFFVTGIKVRLTPQIDFGNSTWSSVSSLARAWATPISGGELASVVESFVEFVGTTWEWERASWLGTLANGV